jgi:hypothetical protein
MALARIANAHAVKELHTRSHIEENGYLPLRYHTTT